VSIKVHLHKTHREFTNGRDIVETTGNNVDECLKNLVIQYPALKEALFEKKGKLKNTIEVYINQESAYPNELKKQTKDGDTIHLILMIAGG
jgi:molybdopterin converting factor small subunit